MYSYPRKRFNEAMERDAILLRWATHLALLGRALIRFQPHQIRTRIKTTSRAL